MPTLSEAIREEGKGGWGKRPSPFTPENNRSPAITISPQSTPRPIGTQNHLRQFPSSL